MLGGFRTHAEWILNGDRPRWLVARIALNQGFLCNEYMQRKRVSSIGALDEGLACICWYEAQRIVGTWR